MASRKTVYVDSDVLVIGGGFGGCGAAYESRYWGRYKKIVVVEKANIERSGAVAQGLYAINCFIFEIFSSGSLSKTVWSILMNLNISLLKTKYPPFIHPAFAWGFSLNPKTLFFLIFNSPNLT